MRSSEPTSLTELHELALHKAAAVLGPGRASRLIERLLCELEIQLESPQDLFVLSEAMTKLGGFEGAVGAMLGVVAVMRGASPSGRGGSEPPQR